MLSIKVQFRKHEVSCGTGRPRQDPRGRSSSGAEITVFLQVSGNPRPSWHPRPTPSQEQQRAASSGAWPSGARRGSGQGGPPAPSPSCRVLEACCPDPSLTHPSPVSDLLTHGFAALNRMAEGLRNALIHSPLSLAVSAVTPCMAAFGSWNSVPSGLTEAQGLALNFLVPFLPPAPTLPETGGPQ